MLLFVSLLAAAITFFLGALVYFHDRESLTNKIYFTHSAVIAMWCMFNYASVSVPAAQALFWIRLVLLLAVPHVFLFFLFVLNFPNPKLAISKRSLWFLLGWMGVLMVITQTKFFFQGLSIDNGQPIPLPGALIPNVAGALVIVSLVTFILILRKYIVSKDLAKLQWRSISIGLVTSYTLLLGLVLLPVIYLKLTTFVNYSSVFVLPIFAGAAYAILRHQFLNVKVITTELISFFLIFIGIWQILLAKTLPQILLEVAVTVLLLIFSILLIRSVLNEVRQREQLQLLSAQLEKANEQLKILDQAKSEFLSVASHQLRTPLTAIKGYASMFLSGDFGPVPDLQRQNLQVIYDSAQRLAVLVSDLLDLSRIESGRMEFDFKAVNLCEIIESVITEVTPKAKDRKLYVFFDNVNRACPDIRADAEKLRQVVINLIDNAIKYTPHGGVTVRLIQAHGQLQFSVTDTGIGIDPAEKDKMFEKFFRSEAANELTREGTGLGIYVVKKIVEAHGGKIWFESPGVNKGTTFFFTLPVPAGPIKAEKVKIDSLEAF